MYKDIVLSTGNICPRCGCDSLREYIPFLKKFKYGYMQKHYNCILLCGMDFGLSRLNNGNIKIGYDKKNEEWLVKRFKFKPERSRCVRLKQN